jgi:selT/selW/selH-like putative selenoprotein
VKAWIEARGHGAVELQQGTRGQFDVVVDGRTVYSRHDTGRFPSEAELARIPF